MIAFLLGPLGKYVAWLVGALVIIAVAAIMWFTVVHKIEMAATEKYIVQQQQQIIQAQQDLAKKTEELTKTGNDISDWAEKLNQDSEAQSKEIEDWIGNQKDTVPFDPLFNQTLDHLRNRKKK